MKYDGLALLKANAESKRAAARAFAADIEKLSQKMIEATKEAEGWELQATLLEIALIDHEAKK